VVNFQRLPSATFYALVAVAGQRLPAGDAIAALVAGLLAYCRAIALTRPARGEPPAALPASLINHRTQPPQNDLK
jgi:hypothetical protein